ncbi:MAG: alpha-amylase family glycosyl hydrolase, partial [Bacteroidota bacterium]
CIELMPIMEFEGNISWGYNPSFFFATDKYYGTEYDLKAFIDSCHARGIVVLLDMVLNHAFGQCPLVQLYWDGSRPSANSPWFNQEPTHPFNVGFDFNHEAEATQYFVDRVLAYWVEEFRFDGYRMDLSKGFTQVNNLNDVGAWSAYDASRIALLNRMYGELLAVDSTVYFTLEHLGANNEEKELAEAGMMLWQKMTDPYANAVEGDNLAVRSFLNGIVYQERNWEVPHNITYMESHDEERLMVFAKDNGFAEGFYDVKRTEIALDRMELAATFFFPIPGPRMFWQFGELGYDFPINFNGRTGPKPIRWDYFVEERRRDVYDVYSALIKLRDKDSVFQTEDFTLDTRPAVKRVFLRGENGSDAEVFIIGNFGVTIAQEVPEFPSTGTWYEYFSQDSLEVTDLNQDAYLAPGEYFIFSKRRYEQDDVVRELRSLFDVFTSIDGPAIDQQGLRLIPNPSSDQSLTLRYELNQASEVKVELLDLQGRSLAVIHEGKQSVGSQEISWQGNGLSQGVYLVRVATEFEVQTLKWVVR